MDYFDGQCDRATISLSFSGGKWSACCREWKCEAHGNTMTDAVSKITRDIDRHNAEGVSDESRA